MTFVFELQMIVLLNSSVRILFNYVNALSTAFSCRSDLRNSSIYASILS